MAEAVGLVASIVQIAGTGAKLSSALYHFTTSAVRADQDIADIASDIDLTSNALESIGKVFETEDTQSIISKKAILDANSIIKRCEAVFRDIADLVEKRRVVSKHGKKSLSVMGKLSWPMKEQRVELYRRRLESLKNSLTLLLHVLQLAQGQSRGSVDIADDCCAYADYFTGSWKEKPLSTNARRSESFTSASKTRCEVCKRLSLSSAKFRLTIGRIPEVRSCVRKHQLHYPCRVTQYTFTEC